jgi:hypothetical protein
VTQTSAARYLHHSDDGQTHCEDAGLVLLPSARARLQRRR